MPPPQVPGRERRHCNDFRCQSQNEIHGFLRNRRPSGLLSSFAVIPMSCDQLAMPAKNRFRRYDPCNLLEHLPTEDLPFDGKAAPLFVVQQDSPFPKLLPQHPVFDQEILDRILLATIDPASENQKR